jgi:predicted PurR-regulated permease PerM
MDRRLFLTLVLFAAAVLVVYAFGRLFAPFAVPIAWAMCLSAATARPYRALAKRWNRPRLAAAALTAATAFVVVVPALFIVWMALHEVLSLADGGLDQAGSRLREVLPNVYERGRELIARFGGDPDRVGKDLVARMPGLIWGGLAQGAWSVLGSLGAFAVGFLFMLATQYSLYLAGPRVRRFLRDLAPLDPERTDSVLEVLRTTTVAALSGGVVVALVQGLLAGVGYVIAGVPSPVLWGMLTCLAALVPVGGAALVWVPAVGWLFLVGETGSAVFLLVFSALLVSTLDNILRPWLLSRQGGVAIHPLLLLFAVLGGIGLFGMSGIVFGPLLIAFLTTLAYLYREHVVPVLAQKPPVAPLPPP